MIRALLIDDEKHALDALEDLLSDFDNVTIVDKFVNPLQALQTLRELPALSFDVIFLDIEMPGMNGLEAAELIMQQFPETPVIFITAYDQYAIEAFELSALDYLLKPVRYERMEKTLQRLENAVRSNRSDDSNHSSHKDSGESQASLEFFNTFQLKLSSDRNDVVKWRTLKARELFIYLLHHKSERVHKAKILDNVWPELELEKAQVYLHTCIYQIRKVLKACKLEQQIRVNFVQQSYQLECEGLEQDVEHFLQAAENPNEICATTVRKYEQAVELYGEGYLHHEDFPWATDRQTALLLHYQQLIVKLVSYYVQHRNWTGSMMLIQRALAGNPLHEPFHVMAMRAYAAMDDLPGLVRHYNELKQVFIRELAVEPGESVQQLYRELCDLLKSTGTKS